MKYHLDPETGEVNWCRATLRSCRYGETAHHDSAEEARAAYEALHALPNSLRRRLSPAQVSALTSYQGGVYSDLNHGLREDPDFLIDKHWAMIEQLDSMFDASGETPPEQVYRVVYAGDSVAYLDHQFKAGDIIVEDGYFSTSESEEFVEDCFDSGLNDEPVNTLMTIEVPSHARCVRPTLHTYNHDHEVEVLFPRGLRFEVLEDDQSYSRRYITLRMLED